MDQRRVGAAQHREGSLQDGVWPVPHGHVDPGDGNIQRNDTAAKRVGLLLDVRQRVHLGGGKRVCAHGPQPHSPRNGGPLPTLQGGRWQCLDSCGVQGRNPIRCLGLQLRRDSRVPGQLGGGGSIHELLEAHIRLNTGVPPQRYIGDGRPRRRELDVHEPIPGGRRAVPDRPVHSLGRQLLLGADHHHAAIPGHSPRPTRAERNHGVLEQPGTRGDCLPVLHAVGRSLPAGRRLAAIGYSEVNGASIRGGAQPNAAA